MTRWFFLESLKDGDMFLCINKVLEERLRLLQDINKKNVSK